MHNFHYISETDIQHLALADEELMVFITHVSDLKESLADRLSVLSKEEADKAQSFRNEIDRNTYACAHALLRKILSVLYNCKPEELFFLKETSGKPYVQPSNIISGNRTIHFSLSHSGSYVALSFHAQSPVGVDVEQINPEAEYEQIVSDYFSEEEKKDYALAENKILCFLRLWTAKEAAGKVSGDGIATLPKISLPEGYQTKCFNDKDAVCSVCFPVDSVSKNYYII
ncbi:MAG: 4'-phosphopantetheinyl transferase superfamily protein [Bacteroidetes bacterium]|jgi:4'-phosphopantetheinyl transferase|nr:4'-phosphopantetheinyl transferase superfamily protein [Bacteroidota bacterium]